MNKELLREIVYISVGAGTGVLLRDNPDYVFPSDSVIEAVESVLETFGYGEDDNPHVDELSQS